MVSLYREKNMKEEKFELRAQKSLFLEKKDEKNSRKKINGANCKEK